MLLLKLHKKNDTNGTEIYDTCINQIQQGEQSRWSQINKINYFYQSEKDVNYSKLNNLFKSSSIEYFRRLKKFKISNSWDLRFFIYHDLRLNNLGKIDKSKSKLLQTYKLKYLSDTYIILDKSL